MLYGGKSLGSNDKFELFMRVTSDRGLRQPRLAVDYVLFAGSELDCCGGLMGRMTATGPSNPSSIPVRCLA